MTIKIFSSADSKLLAQTHHCQTKRAFDYLDHHSKNSVLPNNISEPKTA